MSEKKTASDGWAIRLAETLGLKPQQASLLKLIAGALVLGILFMNAGELFGLDREEERPAGAIEVAAPPGAPQDELTRMERDIAQNLEQTLALIQGAGQVRVTVTLESGPTVTAIADGRVDTTTTVERAGDGSTRETRTENKTQTNVTTKTGSSDSLAVMKKSRAKIAGVLIVAEGARSATVRARIYDAALIALSVPGNRIVVVPAEGR